MRIDAAPRGGYTCTRRRAGQVVSSLTTTGRRALRRAPRLLVRVTLRMVSGAGVARTVTGVPHVRLPGA